MFCHNCGRQNPDNYTICGFCGAKRDTPGGGLGGHPSARTYASGGGLGGYPQARTYAQGGGLGGLPPASAYAKEKSVDVLSLIASIILAISVFLPCYSVFGRDIAFMDVEKGGLLILVCALIMMVLIITKQEKFACLPGIAVMALLFIFCMRAAEYDLGKFGVGMYVMWISAIAASFFPFIKAD